MIWSLIACGVEVVDSAETDSAPTEDSAAVEVADAPETAGGDEQPVAGECAGGPFAAGGVLPCGSSLAVTLTAGEPVTGWGSCLPAGFTGVEYTAAESGVWDVETCDGSTVTAYALGSDGSCLAVGSDGAWAGVRLMAGGRLAVRGGGAARLSVACY
jgi:hypothetical protein